MATSKQFGLSGIGSDVQLGKAGGRLVFATDFKATGTDGSTLVNLQAAAPTAGDHVATKTYVDALSSGLDPKESVRFATTGPINLATHNLTVTDGITPVAGDRVLVKDQTVATENGIYIVVAAGAWTRSTDMDGTPANEVSGGNYTFVESGTANINSGWVLDGQGILTLGSAALNWIQFSGAGSIASGSGLVKSGNTLSVSLFDVDGAPSITDLSGTATVAGDLMFVGDQTGTVTGSKTVGEVLNDLNVPQFPAFTQSATLVRTADDVYIESVQSASTAAAQEGIILGGTPAAPTIGLDIAGLTAQTTVAGTDTILLNDGTNNLKTTVGAIFTDMAVITDPGAGLVVSDGSGNFSAATIAPTTAGQGIAVTNGATAPTIALDINGTTAIATALGLTDTFAVYDSSATANAKATMQDIVDLVALSGSDNEISNGTSSVTIAAAGGDVVTTVAGSVVSTSSASGTTFNSITVSDLTATQVAYAGTAGSLDSDAGMTYTQGSATLTATNIDAATSLTAASATVSSLTDNRITFAGVSGLLEDSANLTFDGTNLAVGGTAGLTVAGNGTVTGTLTSTAGLVSSNLSVANAIVTSTAAGVLSESANLTFDGTILSVTGNVDITGDLDIDNININGNTISSTDLNGNIVIAPNGTGEVIIGSTGSPAQLIAEDDQSLTVAGGAGVASAGGDLNLLGGDGAGAIAGGTVTIAAGDSGTGTEGTIKLDDANGNQVIEITNTAAGQTEYLTAAANGILTLVGTATNADITLDPKGTGTVIVADEATYTANVVAASLTTKAYVDAAITANTSPGSVATVSGTVDLSSATVQNLDTNLIPANATITEVKISVSAASDAATTVTIGDASNGAASYAGAAESDAAATGLYVADCFVANGGSAVQAIATVATAGSTGSATVIITYRNA